MTDRLVVELAAEGRVSVSPWLEGELLPGEPGEPCPLDWPLDANALEELRWYLEDYLRAPFGVYEDQGPGIAARLPAWGEAVFGAVFGAGPARDAYQQMRARPGGVQLMFRSGSAPLLGLPWELMRDPARGLPMALDAGVAGIDRTLPTTDLGASFEVPGGRLRVLMVISRPAGPADVGFRMIARPLLERLDAVRGRVDLVVLRPPTLDALAQTLTEAQGAGEPFQVVHFDGHGVLTGRHGTGAGAPGMFQDPGPEGVLVFQAADGSRDAVPASRVAQVLGSARVPVVVLNACQSGAVGKELEAAVATRLLQGGSASVVAMAYSVYAVAAAEFMAAFYERLFAGDTVSAAVTAGRQRLFRHDRRPSPKGDLPLADWVVPVHYLRREVRFPGLVTARPAGVPSLEEALDRLAAGGPGGAGGMLAPVGVFTGRDGLFYELETAARLQKVVILQGPAGTGKTELAKAFGRWWQDTGGVEQPGWVFWHSFEPGLASFGLDGVIAEIGLSVFGPDFARLDAAQRTGVVKGFLWERRALLIWDNFESVSSVPDPSAATPPLEEAGCQQLRGFLQNLAAAGRSAVLVTSRSEETWLDDAAALGRGSGGARVRLRRLRVPGLTPEEATEYVGDLLAPYPAAAPRRVDRAFGELMQWLDGHPLSMRLVLPHLDSTGPAALLAGLQGAAPLPGLDDGPGGRLTSLAASLGYSYAHLDPVHQRLLAAVCLFHGPADVQVLANFSDADGVPPRFRGASLETWWEVLDAAAGAGLLTGIGRGMYRIHPALPAYLAARWRTEDGVGYDGQRAAAAQALLSVYASLGQFLREHTGSADAGTAYPVIGLHRRTMGHLLGYALDGQLWDEAHAIAQPLSEYWDRRGLSAEAAAWADRVRLATEDTDGVPPGLDSAAGALWLFFVDKQAQWQADSGRLDTAERTYGEILAMLQAQPTSPRQERHLAATYHNLGWVAYLRGRLGEAAEWYRKALAIREELGDQRGLAGGYHNLGAVAQHRGRLDEAADWYARSLAIKEELGDQRGLATSYHNLGALAQHRGRLDEAADWYARSLAITEELGEWRGLADSCHNLGIIAQDRGRLDEAAEWYRKALAIREELGDQRGLVHSYGQLGIVAQSQGRLDEAAEWYRKALAISEQLGDQRGLADSYRRLGTVAQSQGRLDEAAEWYRKALAISEQLGDRPGLAKSYGQLGTVAQSQGRLDEATEWYARSLAITEELGHQPTMAIAYRNLGAVAQSRGRLDEAAEWCRKALAISEEFGDRPGLADGYHDLGIIAHGQGRLDEAAEWYARSLTITEELGDRPKVALTYSHLGQLAEEQHSPGQALEWAVRCVALFEDVPHPGSGTGADQLARLTLQLGIQALEACWQQVTGSSLPGVIRDYVHSYRPDPGDTPEEADQ